MPNDSLQAVVKLHNQVQKVRVAQGNRVFAARELGHEEQAEIHARWHVTLQSLENDIERTFKQVLVAHPAWPWLQRIRGVGPGLAASILSEIDFERCNTTSALWRYAGLAVKDGKREYPTKGEKLPYNKHLKRSMYLFSVSQLRSKGPYMPLYYQAKEKYTKDRTEWTKLHVHYASLRIPQKLFLQHLWVVSRAALDLSTEGPWISVYGGKTDTRGNPWDMVDDE